MYINSSTPICRVGGGGDYHLWKYIIQERVSGQAAQGLERGIGGSEQARIFAYQQLRHCDESGVSNMTHAW
jgi:hypothetical protein